MILISTDRCHESSNLGLVCVKVMIMIFIEKKKHKRYRKLRKNEIKRHELIYVLLQWGIPIRSWCSFCLNFLIEPVSGVTWWGSLFPTTAKTAF